MIPETLIDYTTSHFPRFADHEVKVAPIEKGGSDRKFYRIAIGEHSPDRVNSLILIKYSDGREENKHYVAIARFLSTLGVQVPQIYYHDEHENLIWMQDLGAEDLYTYRLHPWEIRRALYEKALQQAFRLHSIAHRALPAKSLSLQAEFNVDLYRWEQNYFFENCIARHFAVSDSIDHAPLTAIAERLASLPRVFVHRDLQSQNIMILNDDAWLIDFQGMRPGLAQYDLASLLYDPYVSLTANERQFLLHSYMGKMHEADLAVSDDFLEIFNLCAMQRLMQALGAYGFLGHVKERPHFLEHIPAALANLREVVAEIPAAQSLQPLLDRCAEQAS